MKKVWKYFKIIITIGIFLLFVFYFINNKENLFYVLSIPLNYLTIILLLISVGFFLNGLFIRVVLKSFDKNLPKLEAFYVSIISSLGNYFLPMRGGAVIRSVYLKKKFNFPYSHFISTLYGNYIIVFLINALVAIIALIIIQFNSNIVSIPLYLFFGSLLLTMFFLSFFKFPTGKIKEIKNGLLNKIINIIKNIFEGWNIIIADRILLLSLMFLTLANFFFSTILFFVEFKALEIPTNIVSVLLYNCLSGVSLLISLTPGSLGIREGLFIITSNILGVNSNQIMQLALLDRGSIVFVLFFWFIILSVYKKIKNEKL